MFKAYAPFLIQFSPEARALLNQSISTVAPMVFRTVAAAQAGFDIAHLPVRIGEDTFAASSRIMPSGTIIIELDVAPQGLTPRVVTGVTLRNATKIAFARGGRIAR